MGEPQVALDLEPRWVHQPVRGIWDRVIWPDLSDLRAEQRFRPSPADPLGDRRRRHRRRPREQPSHVGYESVEARPARRPLIRRLAVFRQRPIDGPSPNSSQSCYFSLRNPGREQVAYLRPAAPNRGPSHGSEDLWPRLAIRAAREFMHGAERTRLQRVTALGALGCQGDFGRWNSQTARASFRPDHVCSGLRHPVTRRTNP